VLSAAVFVVLKGRERTPVVSDVVLEEGTLNSTVVLETGFRQISGAEGKTYDVGGDAPAGWVPVYTSEAQRRMNMLYIGLWNGNVPPAMRVKLMIGPQIMVTTRTKLVPELTLDLGGLMVGGGELYLEVAGGTWRLSEATKLDREPARSISKWTGGVLDEKFLGWWSKRARDGSRWRMRFGVEPGIDGGRSKVKVVAVRLS